MSPELMDFQKAASGKYAKCACGNWFKGDQPYCNFCHRFNAGGVNNCPTCGQPIAKAPKEPEV